MLRSGVYRRATADGVLRARHDEVPLCGSSTNPGLPQVSRLGLIHPRVSTWAPFCSRRNGCRGNCGGYWTFVEASGSKGRICTN